MMNGRVSIRVEGLNFFYGKKQALFGVSIEIYRNQITALIGPSGCGKSTFLKVLNRMHELVPGARAEGRVTIEGADIYNNGVDVAQLRKTSGWCSRRPTPSLSPSTTTWCLGRSCTGFAAQEIWRLSSRIACEGPGCLTRLKTGFENPHSAFRGAAAAALHRQGLGSGPEDSSFG